MNFWFVHRKSFLTSIMQWMRCGNHSLSLSPLSPLPSDLFTRKKYSNWMKDIVGNNRFYEGFIAENVRGKKVSKELNLMEMALNSSIHSQPSVKIHYFYWMENWQNWFFSPSACSACILEWSEKNWQSRWGGSDKSELLLLLLSLPLTSFIGRFKFSYFAYLK